MRGIHKKEVTRLGIAERRLKLMRFLCQCRHETLPKLAAKFGVSVRTIQRDIDEISDIFPIYVKTGRYNGGVYVIDGFYLDRMYMNDSEIALLKKINAERVKLSLSFEETETLNKIIMSYQKPVV